MSNYMNDRPTNLPIGADYAALSCAIDAAVYMLRQELPDDVEIYFNAANTAIMQKSNDLDDNSYGEAFTHLLRLMPNQHRTPIFNALLTAADNSLMNDKDGKHGDQTQIRARCIYGAAVIIQALPNFEAGCLVDLITDNDSVHAESV